MTLRRYFASGERDGYWWYEWIDGDLNGLLNWWPEVVQQRRVVVATFDSSPFRVTEEEHALGWSQRGDLAVSPVLSTPEELPGFDGYDELWIFDDHSDLPDAITASANNGSFRLSDPSDLVDDLPATWDEVAAQSQHDLVLELQNRFWQEIESLRPLTCAIVGERLCVVTRDAAAPQWLSLYGVGQPGPWRLLPPTYDLAVDAGDDLELARRVIDWLLARPEMNEPLQASAEPSIPRSEWLPDRSIALVLIDVPDVGPVRGEIVLGCLWEDRPDIPHSVILWIDNPWDCEPEEARIQPLIYRYQEQLAREIVATFGSRCVTGIEFGSGWPEPSEIGETFEPPRPGSGA